jgi:MFS superfamily sulfate permease-like transporter
MSNKIKVPLIILGFIAIYIVLNEIFGKEETVFLLFGVILGFLLCCIFFFDKLFNFPNEIRRLNEEKKKREEEWNKIRKYIWNLNFKDDITMEDISELEEMVSNIESEREGRQSILYSYFDNHY